jgi:RHS repeat-associated protein/uncharacterized repeat protein (TIGR01451 family)
MKPVTLIRLLPFLIIPFGLKATDLSVEKSCDKTEVNAGELITYTIVVNNSNETFGGPYDSPNTLFTDSLPDGVTFRSASASNGAEVTHDASDGSLFASLETIPAGQTVTITVVVEASLPGEWTNNARAAGDEFDPNLENNNGSCTVTIAEPLPPSAGGGTNIASPGSAADPINTTTGELYLTAFPDLELSGPMDLVLERTYNSSFARNRVESLIGMNWRHSFDWDCRFSEGELTIVTSTGRVLKFLPEGDPAEWVLQTNLHRPFQLIETDDKGAPHYHLFDPRTRLRYRFATPEGLAAMRLVEIRDPYGARLDLAYGSEGRLDTVSDGLGREFTFSYENGLLASVTDGERTVSYAYVDSFLTGFTDTGGFETTYSYTDAGGFEGLLVATTLPEGNQPLQQAWDAVGRVASQSNAAGDTTTLSYGANETTVTHPDGSTTVHAIDADGNLGGLTDPAGREIGIAVDTEGRRESVTRPSGSVFEEIHDPETGLVLSRTHAEGGTTTFTYAEILLDPGFACHEIAEINFPDGTTRKHTFDGSGNPLTVTDRNGSTWTYTYNSLGKLTSVTNPLGGTQTLAYDGSGNLASWTDAAGNTTTYTYDALSRLVTIDYTGPAIRTYTYDYANRITSIGDDTGTVQAFSFDANGRLVEETVSDGTTAWTFDDSDRMSTMTLPSGDTLAFAYDNRSRITSVTMGDRVVDYSFDAAGELISVSAPGLGEVTRTLDAGGRPASTTDAEGRSIAYSLDANGLTTSATGPGGEAWTYTYDSMGRVIERTYPDGQVDSYSWSGENLLIGISVDPAGLSTAFEHDAMGNLLSVTRNGQSEWSFQYDSAARMTTATDPLGNTISFTYDAGNRWDVVTFPESMGSVQFSYDSSGLITRRLYSDGTDIQTSYDERGRKTATENLSLVWDAVNRPVESNGILMTWEPYTSNVKTVTVAPGKTVTYAYDIEGRLSSVSDWTGGGVTFTYDDSGRVLTESFANGLVTTYTYDGLGRVLSVDHGAGAVSVTRAPGGSITGIENTLPAPPHPGFSDRTFTHNDLNQIETFSHDALGRRTADDRGSYTYDLADRLTAVTRDGTSATFSHDGNGLLTGLSIGAENRAFVWNYAFELPFPQIERSGGMDTYYYVAGPGGNLLYRIDALANQAEYYHFDPLGHTRAVSDNQGSLVATYAYSPYGNVAVSDADFHNPFTYVGRYGIIHLPQLELYNMRHRFYDPDSRQFLTRDPLYVLPYPATTAPYQYAAGDPLNNIDPTGLAPVNGTVANVNSSTSDGGFWDTASKATGSASLGSFIGQHGGKKLDQLADAASASASQAQRAHRSLQNVARAAGNSPSVPKILDNAGDFARQANRLDQATDLMRTGSKPLSALGKAGKAIGPLSIAVEAVRGYKRIGRSIAQTDELLRVTYEAYEARVDSIVEIYLSGKKSEEWFKEQMDANLAGYMEEYNGISDAGLYDSLIGVWVTAGDMIGTLLPGYGILFGTEDIANFTHKHVWQKIYH